MRLHLSAFDPSSLLPIVGEVLSPFVSQAIVNNFSTLEIRTTLSPPVTLSMTDLLNNNAPPNPFAGLLKPTVILTDRAGKRNVLAPFGVAEGGYSGLVGLAALFGGVFLLGRLSNRLF